MHRLNTAHATRNRGGRSGTAGNILCVLMAGACLFAIPGLGSAADWLAPGANQTVTAPWVKDITAQLDREPYRDVFVSAPSEPPHPAIVRYLNSAAEALKAGNKPLAQSYVDRTIGIFDTGVVRGYYSRVEVEPIKKMIRTRAEAAIKGEPVVSAVQTDNRWTGYTQHKPLGLVNEMSRMTSENPEPKK